jgi:hypothetical protein
MSNDYKTTKPNPTHNYPQGATKLTGAGAAGFSRVDPWMTPDRLKNEFLFGIPLVSLLTGQTLTDIAIKNIIRRAAADVELKCKIDIFPVQRVHREDFDRTKYLQGWNQLQLPFGNLKSLEEVSIRANNSLSFNQGVPNTNQYGNSFGVPSNGQTQPNPPNPQLPQFNPNEIEGDALYIVPLDWIDMTKAAKGLLHFVPLQTTFSSYGVVGPSAGAAAPLFAIFSQLSWVPSFWFIKYTCGFDENSIPSPINELIGYYAAMEIISLLGPLIRHTSQSIGIDGASQSTSGPGYQLFVLRYQQLQEKAKESEDLIKSRFGKKIFMSHI